MCFSLILHDIRIPVSGHLISPAYKIFCVFRYEGNLYPGYLVINWRGKVFLFRRLRIINHHQHFLCHSLLTLGSMVEVPDT